MESQSLEEITGKVLKLYDDDVNVDEIAVMTNSPRYLIESILISQREVYFR